MCRRRRTATSCADAHRRSGDRVIGDLIALVGAGLGAVIANVQVVFVAIAAWLLHGERPTRQTMGTIVLVLAGVALTSGLARHDAYGSTVTRSRDPEHRVEVADQVLPGEVVDRHRERREHCDQPRRDGVDGEYPCQQ